jgi:hypothetical protein
MERKEDRQIDNRQTNLLICGKTEIYIWTNRHTNRKKDEQTVTQSKVKMDRQTDEPINIQKME